ncbi:hypothetical protein EZV73_02495 [Acidaminobacter sp. JC074]|uniref:aspartyl protease family protein n=1 Tax=Acidaminobacter sp. JC074 TaxID=2530199 RepID=UPI001F111AFA|nr:aspartyl protease family protein [Acidaminobacter sp. JC074]MCH4886416.1 hypothetical protein [Acidaminobacter sp. JC074]
MFHKYKSRVTRLENSLEIDQVEGYKKVIKEIREANDDFIKDKEFFYHMLEEFPPLKIIKSYHKTYPIELYPSGIMLDVRINSKPFKFLVDTGAQVSCIHEKHLSDEGMVASSKHLDIGDAFGTLNDMKLAYAKSASILNMKIENLPLLVIKNHPLLIGADGIIGWDILSLLDFELDLVNKEIKMIEKEKDIVNFPKSKFPLLLVYDLSKQVRVFGIDTGAKKSWIHERLIESNKLSLASSKNVRSRGINGMVKRRVLLVKDYQVIIDNHMVTFENIATGFTALLGDYELDGVLGRDILLSSKSLFLNSDGGFHLETY